MAPRPRSTKLENRDQRRRLKVQKKAYAKKVLPGLRLLYRRNRSGGVWYAERYEGNGIYQNLGLLGAADDFADSNGIDVLSYDDAVRKILTIGDEKVREQKGLPPVESTVKKAMAGYFADYRSRARCKETSKRAAELAAEKHIYPKLGHILLSELSQVKLRGWLNGIAKAETEATADEIRKRQATANRVRSILFAGLNFAHNHGEASAAQMADWRKVKPFRKVDVPRIRYLTTDEAKRFLNCCDAEFRPLAEAALLTGGRYSEITSLRVGDYDPQTGTVFFAAGKSAADRYVPLTSEGQRFFDAHTAGKVGKEIIFTRADGRQWRKSEQARPMKRACKKAKIEPISYHILRHTFGSLLATKGVAMKFIAEVLGHVDTRVTERHYSHLHKSVVHEVIRASLPDFGVVASNVIPLRKNG